MDIKDLKRSARFTDLQECLLDAANFHQGLVIDKLPSGDWTYREQGSPIEPGAVPSYIKMQCNDGVTPLHKEAWDTANFLNDDKAFRKEYKARAQRACKENNFLLLSEIDPTWGDLYRQMNRLN